ncbi:MAG: EAL domain-containing protein, partial [Rhodobacteraceae bacterium]|nr:EAL domain-containing protein [Paracoccaceae bacterium]
MSSVRDRFVAFAFCWADLLVELDKDRRVLFAVGAAQPLLGYGAEKLIGQDFMALVSPKDRVLLDQMLQMTAKGRRMDNMRIKLEGTKGQTPPLAVAGYILPDLKDHVFIALRASARPDDAGETLEGVQRDKTTGLLSGESFSESAAQKLKALEEKGQPAELTLVNLPGFEAFAAGLSEDERQVLRNTVATSLRANALDGDSAGEIGDGKYGLVHEKGLDVKAIENKIAEATKAFDPSGKGLDVQSGTVDLDLNAISEEDLTKGLVYTINHFKDQAGDKFNVASIAQNMNNLVQEAANSLKTFRSIVGGSDFQVAFHPILDVRSGAVHHYEALVRFGGNFEQSPYKYITFAEETGLINEFDIAMARKCVEWLRKNKGDKVSLAVNISGMSVDNPVYAKQLHELLDADTWLKKFLVFEITESARVADLQ